MYFNSLLGTVLMLSITTHPPIPTRTHLPAQAVLGTANCNRHLRQLSAKPIMISATSSGHPVVVVMPGVSGAFVPTAQKAVALLLQQMVYHKATTLILTM